MFGKGRNLRASGSGALAVSLFIVTLVDSFFFSKRGPAMRRAALVAYCQGRGAEVEKLLPLPAGGAMVN